MKNKDVKIIIGVILTLLVILLSVLAYFSLSQKNIKNETTNRGNSTVRQEGTVRVIEVTPRPAGVAAPKTQVSTPPPHRPSK